MTALTAYMPALIFVNGKVAIAHILVGYLGILALSSAVSAVGVFGSSSFVDGWRQRLHHRPHGDPHRALDLVGITDPPFAQVTSYAAMWNQHFTPFQEGRLTLSSLTYYTSVTVLFFLWRRASLKLWRWE